MTTSCSNQKPSDIWSLDSEISGAHFPPQTYLPVCKNSPALISLINPLPQLCCSLRERWRQFNPLLNCPPMIYAEDCKWSDSILKGSQNLITTTYRTNSHTLSPFLFAVKKYELLNLKKKSKETFGIFTGTNPEWVSWGKRWSRTDIMVRNTRGWCMSAKSCSLASKGREKGNPSLVFQLRGKGRVWHSKHNEAKTAWSYPQMISKWVIYLRSNCSIVVIRYCRREDNGREGSIGVVL